MKKNRALIIIITILAAAIVIFAILNSRGTTEKSAKTAIDFTLKDQYGNEHTLSDYKGKTVVVNFWATWCPSCRNELPAFQEAYDNHGKNEKDVVILGVYAPDFDKEGTSEQVIDYFKGEGLDYPILADKDAAVFSDYAISGLPTTIMFDKDGNEATRNTGVMNSSELETIIKRVADR